MRCAAIVACMLVLFLVPARGAETPINLSVSLDWKGFSEPMALTMKFQQSGLFPLPMLYVAGKLSGLVPSTVSVNLAGGSASMEVGVAQVLERPLYNVEINKTSTGDLAVQIEFVDLSMVRDYSIAGRSGPAVILNHLDHSQLQVHANNGVYALPLPAAPLAALVEYASNTDGGMTLGHVVPLILHDPQNDRRYPPITTYLHVGKETGLVLTLQASEPTIYAKTISLGWLSQQASIAAQAGSIAAGGYPSPSVPSRPLRLLEGPQQPSLELDSIPTRAEIVTSGTLESPPFTNTVTQMVRSLWSTTVIRKTGFRDCPVDVAQVTPGTLGGAEYKFTCKLQRN